MAVGSGANSIRAFINHLIPFLIQQQVYSCTYTDSLFSDADQICTRQNICDGDARIAGWEIDYTNDRSLDNWQQ